MATLSVHCSVLCWLLAIGADCSFLEGEQYSASQCLFFFPKLFFNRQRWRGAAQLSLFGIRRRAANSQLTSEISYLRT